MGIPARDFLATNAANKASTVDGLMTAVLAAPMGAPLSAAERAVLEEADRSFASGEASLSLDDIELTILRMREEQGDALES